MLLVLVTLFVSASSLDCHSGIIDFSIAKTFSLQEVGQKACFKYRENDLLVIELVKVASTCVPQFLYWTPDDVEVKCFVRDQNTHFVMSWGELEDCKSGSRRVMPEVTGIRVDDCAVFDDNFITRSIQDRVGQAKVKGMVTVSRCEWEDYVILKSSYFVKDVLQHENTFTVVDGVTTEMFESLSNALLSVNNIKISKATVSGLCHIENGKDISFLDHCNDKGIMTLGSIGDVQCTSPEENCVYPKNIITFSGQKCSYNGIDINTVDKKYRKHHMEYNCEGDKCEVKSFIGNVFMSISLGFDWKPVEDKSVCGKVENITVTGEVSSSVDLQHYYAYIYYENEGAKQGFCSCENGFYLIFHGIGNVIKVEHVVYDNKELGECHCVCNEHMDTVEIILNVKEIDYKHAESPHNFISEGVESILHYERHIPLWVKITVGSLSVILMFIIIGCYFKSSKTVQYIPAINTNV